MWMIYIFKCLLMVHQILSFMLCCIDIKVFGVRYRCLSRYYSTLHFFSPGCLLHKIKDERILTAVHFFKDAGANTILQDIARARENIQKSLAGVNITEHAIWTYFTLIPMSVAWVISATLGINSVLKCMKWNACKDLVYSVLEMQPYTSFVMIIGITFIIIVVILNVLKLSRYRCTIPTRLEHPTF